MIFRVCHDMVRYLRRFLTERPEQYQQLALWTLDILVTGARALIALDVELATTAHACVFLLLDTHHLKLAMFCILSFNIDQCGFKNSCIVINYERLLTVNLRLTFDYFCS